MQGWVGYVGVGWVMQGWVGHAGVGWGGSCRDGVHYTGVEWAVNNFTE